MQAPPQPQPPQANLAAFGSAGPDDSEWYVDSSATTHITTDLSNLQVQNDYTGTDNVTVGNGSSLPISYVGQASIPSCSSSQSLLLNNILYVPSITKNLLSISQFTKDNMCYLNFIILTVLSRTNSPTRHCSTGCLRMDSINLIFNIYFHPLLPPPTHCLVI